MKIMIDAELWKSEDFRRRALREVRRRAARQRKLFEIILKDRFGRRLIARIDGRFWIPAPY